MHTINISRTRIVRRLSTIAVIGVLALSFAAAVAAIGAEANVTSSGIFATIGEYLTEVGEALVGG